MSTREREDRGEDGKKKKLEKVLESDVLRALEENDLSRAREMLNVEYKRLHSWMSMFDVPPFPLLQLAATAGFADCVKVMIKNGVDVNAVNKSKDTALHKAAEKGHVDVAKALIQNGADVNAVVDAIFFGNTALHLATQNDNVDLVKVLIHSGADVNAVCKLFQQTALHIAVGEGRVDVAKVLLQNGADVNAVTKKEESVLQLATCCKDDYAGVSHRTCALLLLCFGAKIGQKDIERDKIGLLQPINDRLESLRAGNGMTTTLMSNEEGHFMRHVAWFLDQKCPEATFKAYYAMRSFITYNGIFMGPGYDLGDESIWRNAESGDEDY